MKHSTKFALAAASALAAAVGAPGSAQAQNADSLIDKLVEKGILTVKEGQALREESDKDFNRAYSAKTGLPDWVTSMKFGGDFRGRFEQHQIDNTLGSDRNRFRYRLRVGATANMLEDFEVGFRLSSGDPSTSGNSIFGGKAITANTTMQDGASRKFLWVDTAYAKWNPIHNADWNWSVTFGKMDNTLQLSPMVIDADYQPEGAAIQGAYQINDKSSLKFNGVFWVLDEFNTSATANPSPSRDPYMYGLQLIYDTKLCSKIDASLSATWLSIQNKDNLTIGTAPDDNVGNLRDPLTAPAYNFNAAILGGSLTYKLDSFPMYDGAFPVKFGGEWMHNVSAVSQNEAWNAGITLGKAGHKGLWEINYKYEFLRADAWYEEMVDDDFGSYYSSADASRGVASAGLAILSHLPAADVDDFFSRERPETSWGTAHSEAAIRI